MTEKKVTKTDEPEDQYKGKKSFQEVLANRITAFVGKEKKEEPLNISEETDITQKLLFYLFINEVISCSDKYSGIQTLVPALIGRTGVGKTSTVKKIADILNLRTRTLLLQSMLPEEVIGIPFAQVEKTFYPLPDWIPDDGKVEKEDLPFPYNVEKCSQLLFLAEKLQPLTFRTGTFILFLDEFDKARQEVLATILTLLAEKKIRETHLKVIPLIAMQPVTEDWQEGETAEALIARMNFLYFPIEIGYKFIGNKYNINVDKIVKLARKEESPMVVEEAQKAGGEQKIEGQVIIPKLNFLPPRVLEYALAFIDHCRKFEITKDDIRELTRGFLDKNNFKVVWEMFGPGQEISPVGGEDIIKRLEGEQFIKTFYGEKEKGLKGVLEGIPSPGLHFLTANSLDIIQFSSLSQFLTLTDLVLTGRKRWNFAKEYDTPYENKEKMIPDYDWLSGKGQWEGKGWVWNGPLVDKYFDGMRVGYMSMAANGVPVPSRGTGAKDAYFLKRYDKFDDHMSLAFSLFVIDLIKFFSHVNVATAKTKEREHSCFDAITYRWFDIVDFSGDPKNPDEKISDKKLQDIVNELKKQAKDIK